MTLVSGACASCTPLEIDAPPVRADLNALDHLVVTATATSDGEPVPGIELGFALLLEADDDNALTFETVRTDEQGVARWDGRALFESDPQVRRHFERAAFLRVNHPGIVFGERNVCDKGQTIVPFEYQE